MDAEWKIFDKEKIFHDQTIVTIRWSSSSGVKKSIHLLSGAPPQFSWNQKSLKNGCFGLKLVITIIWNFYQNSALFDIDGDILVGQENVSLKLVKGIVSEFIFGLNLNHFYPDGRWNPENVEIFLDYIKEENFQIHFELGNEPNSYFRKYNVTMTPERQGLAIKHLRQLCKERNINAKIYGLGYQFHFYVTF